MIIHLHYGGTALTNFSKIDLPTYVEAIQIFRKKTGHDYYWIAFEGMDGFDLYSLNVYPNYTGVSDDFWNIFDEVNVYLPTQVRKMLQNH